MKNGRFHPMLTPNNEYHFAGEVDYHLLCDDKPYAGLRSHREALIIVFDRLVENSIRDQKSIRERLGDDIADQLHPLVYDINKAHPAPLDPNEFLLSEYRKDRVLR